MDGMRPASLGGAGSVYDLSGAAFAMSKEGNPYGFPSGFFISFIVRKANVNAAHSV